MKSQSSSTPFKWENFDHFYNTAKKRSIEQIGDKLELEILKNVCLKLFTLSERLDDSRYMNPTGFMISEIKKIRDKDDYNRLIEKYERKLNEANLETFKSGLLKKGAPEEERIEEVQISKEEKTVNKTKEIKNESKWYAEAPSYRKPTTSKKPSDTVLKFDGLLPKEPGVYLLFDAKKKLIYIGRSVCLSNRVPGSFVEKKAKYVKLIVTETKADAVIIEPYLILMYNPPSNSEFKTGDSPTFHLKLPPMSEFIEPKLVPKQKSSN